MALAKTKKKIIVNVSLEDAQAASEQYATKSNSLSKLEAKMNEEINGVKSKYQERITGLNKELEEPVEVLHVFATEQSKNWKKKSFELLHCVIGFQTGQPTVTKIKKGFSWDAIVELLKKVPVFKKDFVRSKEEVNKEAILAVKDEAILNQLKEDCFISIEQAETFYVKAKVEEVAPA
jgi:phage host-nuclease inhibitor protein Gam